MVVKSRVIRYVLHVACVKEMRNACSLSVGKYNSEELWATRKLILQMDHEKIRTEHELLEWFMQLTL
jgi:hypothetical protein